MTSLPILLPKGFVPVVAVGDTIQVDQTIAEKKSDSHTVVISIPNELDIPVQKAGRTIKKNPGDSINPGDVIAIKKGFMGMGEQKVLSSVSGRVLTFERRTGELTIGIDEREGETSEGEKDTFPSPVAGKVTLCDNEKIVVETEKDTIIALKGHGSDVTGEAYAIKGSGEIALPLHELTPESIDKIVITSYLDRDGLVKAIGMGCKGIILNTLDESDSSYFDERGTDVPIVQVSDDDFSKLTKWSGKKLFVDGENKSIVLLHV